jgi:hypothetical protein
LAPPFAMTPPAKPSKILPAIDPPQLAPGAACYP